MTYGVYMDLGYGMEHHWSTLLKLSSYMQYLLHRGIYVFFQNLTKRIHLQQADCTDLPPAHA